MKIKIKTCWKWLSIVWFSMSLFLALILMLQTICGQYGDKANEAWGWYAATILPSLSLISGLWIREIRKKVDTSGTVEGFPFLIAMSLSIIYLFFSLIPIGYQAIDVSMKPTELLNQSQLGLGVFQGVVCGYIGAFFATEK